MVHDDEKTVEFAVGLANRFFKDSVYTDDLYESVIIYVASLCDVEPDDVQRELFEGCLP